MYSEIVEKRAHLISERMNMVNNLPVCEQSLSFLKGMKEVLKLYYPDVQTVVWDFEKRSSLMEPLKTEDDVCSELERSIKENIESYGNHRSDLRRLYKLATLRNDSIQEELGVGCESEVVPD